MDEEGGVDRDDKSKVESENDDEENQEDEDDDDDDDDDDDEEEDDREGGGLISMLKPVFVSRDDRETRDKRLVSY